jgi:hypothetical protein
MKDTSQLKQVKGGSRQILSIPRLGMKDTSQLKQVKGGSRQILSIPRLGIENTSLLNAYLRLYYQAADPNQPTSGLPLLSINPPERGMEVQPLICIM